MRNFACIAPIRCFLLGLLLGMGITTMATEVVIMDYSYLDEDAITVYDYTEIDNQENPCEQEEGRWWE